MSVGPGRAGCRFSRRLFFEFITPSVVESAVSVEGVISILIKQVVIVFRSSTSSRLTGRDGRSLKGRLNTSA